MAFRTYKRYSVFLCLAGLVLLTVAVLDAVTSKSNNKTSKGTIYLETQGKDGQENGKQNLESHQVKGLLEIPRHEEEINGMYKFMYFVNKTEK